MLNHQELNVNLLINHLCLTAKRSPPFFKKVWTSGFFGSGTVLLLTAYLDNRRTTFYTTAASTLDGSAFWHLLHTFSAVPSDLLAT